MRRTLYVVTTLAFLMVLPSAYAAEEEQCGFLIPCEPDYYDTDAAGNPTVTKCTDWWGCPQCAMTNDLSNSTCYRVYGNWGYCSCTPNGTYVDQYGIKRPRCTTKGSCTVR